jgi:hypothetical protein
MELIKGQLYRAVTTNELVEVEPPPFQGLKLLIATTHIKRLKALQKAIEKQSGKRPDLTLVLNAMLFGERGLSQRVDEGKYIASLAGYIEQLKKQLEQQKSK